MHDGKAVSGVLVVMRRPPLDTSIPPPNCWLVSCPNRVANPPLKASFQLDAVECPPGASVLVLLVTGRFQKSPDH